MWGTFLSEPLPIDALVGRYPANKLIGRIPIPYRRTFPRTEMSRTETWGINSPFGGLSPGTGQVGYVLLTHSPVAARVAEASPRCPSTCMC